MSASNQALGKGWFFSFLILGGWGSSCALAPPNHPSFYFSCPPLSRLSLPCLSPLFQYFKLRQHNGKHMCHLMLSFVFLRGSVQCSGCYSVTLRCWCVCLIPNQLPGTFSAHHKLPSRQPSALASNPMMLWRYPSPTRCSRLSSRHQAGSKFGVFVSKFPCLLPLLPLSLERRKRGL